MDKYKLEIPRNQYDRIGDAFELEDHFVNGYDINKDTIIFVNRNIFPFKLVRGASDTTWTFSALNTLNWITQIFLPRNIQKYLVK